MNIALKCLVILTLSLSEHVNANTFPSRPLTLLVGFDRGGTVFTQAEALAEVLSDILDQPVTLQVKSGLGGAVAVAMVAQSQSEGYIMLFTVTTPITNTPLSTEISFQIDDFRYVGAISEDQHALVTYSDAPYSDWNEFILYAKQQDEVLYASQTISDRHHINVIAEQESINVRIIPVSGGAGMAPLVLGKDVDFAFSGGTHIRYVDSGQMKVLASSGINRLSEHPGVPTLVELGYDLDMQSLRILAVPKNTPDEQFQILTNALQKAIEDPRLINVTRDVIRHPITFTSGDELDHFMRSRREQYLNQCDRERELICV